MSNGGEKASEVVFPQSVVSVTLPPPWGGCPGPDGVAPDPHRRASAPWVPHTHRSGSHETAVRERTAHPVWDETVEGTLRPQVGGWGGSVSPPCVCVCVS